MACGVVLLALASAGSAAEVESPTLLERRVKSAYLYKFAGYVDWPAAAFHDEDEALRIGVIEEDSLAEELTRLVAGRTAGGRPVEVVKLESTEQIESVHVLFIGRSDVERLRRWADVARAHPVLVVTESPQALAHGSVINFVLDRGRVRFEVNLDAAQRRGLGLSSRLLTVAMAVVTKGH